ncbi:predicted protein [Histoplasma capsulatum var. duboisii H88]|uniref:Predicted protein n=1 Tax=Ajellomyces capsulatus (strain H88) TaxID=544711 RepID=F0US35_AJEC8|nr:predicted protein [Histoplasma capsulatum var. duboisii H88]
MHFVRGSRPSVSGAPSTRSIGKVLDASDDVIAATASDPSNWHNVDQLPVVENSLPRVGGSNEAYLDACGQRPNKTSTIPFTAYSSPLFSSTDENNIDSETR